MQQPNFQTRLLPSLAGVALIATAFLVTSCTPPPPTTSQAPTSPATSAGATATPTPIPVPVVTPPANLPPAAAGVSWLPMGSVLHGTHVTYVGQVHRSQIALLWMNSQALRFRFIPGTVIPESSPATPADNSPSTWVPQMVAAFNGGFMLLDIHPGGYFYHGTTVKALAVGQAAMVLTRSGQLNVGMWGRDLRLNADVVAVRENLPLLVDGYLDRAGTLRGKGAWGRSSQGPLTSNRSALGQLANGNLVYEYGYHVTPEQMAQSMLLVHAKSAIMLDMNGSWPAGFVYWHSKGQIHGQRIQSHVYHSPSLYYTRYRKDFIAVLAP